MGLVSIFPRRTAIQKSDYFTADTALAQCRAIWPTSDQVTLLSVRVARYLSHFTEAETLLRQYRGLHGELSDRMQLEWYLLRAQMGGLEDVVPFLIECVKKEHRDSALILETLSALYIQEGNYPPVRYLLDNLLKMEPDSVVALDLRGIAAEHLGAPEPAMKDYERALELQPDRHDVRRRLVELYLAARQLEKAQDHIDKLMEMEPKNPLHRLVQARCAFEKDDLLAAKKQLDVLLKDVPDMIPALLLRGSVAMQDDDFETAKRCVGQAAELAPNSTMVMEKWHRCLNTMKDPRARRYTNGWSLSARCKKNTWTSA